MRYADRAAVLAELSLQSDNPDDALAIQRVEGIEEGLCDTFDAKVGRSFNEVALPETRTVTVGAPYRPVTNSYPLMDAAGWPRSPRLVLAVPLRSLVGIEEGGRWDGGAWVDGRTLTTDEYLLTYKAKDGYYGIDRLGGSWPEMVRVTGMWADQPVSDLPADVREAMTFLTAETYRQQQASPADELGPDNMVVRPRNPWRYEQVVMAIKRHKIVKVLL